jgi:glycosyltransferase involved in cell wall biosynthesis
LEMGRLGIAYILPNIESGGTERHVLALARRLDRSRFDLSLVTTAGGGSLYPEFSGLLPVTVFGDPQRGRRFRTGPLEQVRTVAAVARLLRRSRPDVVHAYLPAANVIGPVAARLAGVPRVIVSKRALADYKKLYPLLRRVEPFGNRLADTILVNSEAVRRDVERTETHWEGKFRKIYNGVAPMLAWNPDEIQRFRLREALPLRSPVVACVSNFYPYKGHADLVEAIARIASSFPDAVFLLVGRDSGTLEVTRTRAHQLGLDEAVRFAGSRTDVADILRASDLFVHPSLEEGFSNAILEAMAAALPVVASNVGGNAEAVEDGVTGLLVPPRDPAGLAAAMAALLADPVRREDMGMRGRSRAAERFSIDRMVAEMEAMYEFPGLRRE